MKVEKFLKSLFYPGLQGFQAFGASMPWRSLLCSSILFSSFSCPLLAHELKEIQLVSNATESYLNVTFSATPEEGEYPQYFQKVEAAKNTLVLSFLETETNFALGKHSVDSDSGGLQEIQLRKMTSPSGKNFLGLELIFKGAPTEEANVQALPNGILKITVGAGSKKKSKWTLSKALKAKDEYLSKKAEEPPVSAKAMVASTPAASTPSSLESSEAALPASAPNEPPVSAEPIDPKEEEKVEQSLAKPTKPEKSAAMPEKSISPSEQAPTKPAAASAEVSASSLGKNEGAEPPDLTPSAIEAGKALDAARGKKPLSSSKIFTVGMGAKSMVVTKDSIELKDAIEANGKVVKKIALGSKILRLENKGGWFKVVEGSDTGFVRSMGVTYADEMTEAKEKSLQMSLEAKEKKRLAIEAKMSAKELADKRKVELAAKAEADKIIADSIAKAKVFAKEAEIAAAKAEKEAKKLAAMDAKARAQAQAQAQALAEKAAQIAATKAIADSTNAAKAVADSIKMAKPSSNPADKKIAMATKPAGLAPKLAIADNPELAEKLAKEKQAAEDEKMRVEPEEKRITYNSFGRRDPFIPVELGATDNGIDIDQMKVVGIIWQSSEPMAVLEHTREANVSYTVKQGDPVHNGRVARITRETVTFDISEYGISRSYSLKLVSSKEGTKK